METDVITGLGVIIERVSVRIRCRTVRQALVGQRQDHFVETARVVQRTEWRRAPVQIVAADTAAFLVFGDVVSMHRILQLRQFREQAVEHAAWQKILDNDEFILAAECVAQLL